MHGAVRSRTTSASPGVASAAFSTLSGHTKSAYAAVTACGVRGTQPSGGGSFTASSSPFGRNGGHSSSMDTVGASLPPEQQSLVGTFAQLGPPALTRGKQNQRR